MQSMTIEQLRAASDAGGVEAVSPERAGRGVPCPDRHAQRGRRLAGEGRSSEPRRFGNPVAALNVLRDVGITIGQFDASEWNPAEKGRNRRQPWPGRGDAQGAQAAAYETGAAGEIQEAIDDPRPNISHDDVMAEMDADIAALMAERKPAARKRA